MVKLETGQEYKDEYIHHLIFLLEPHLSLLLPKVADETHGILEDIGVVITPTNHQAPKVAQAVADATSTATDA